MIDDIDNEGLIDVRGINMSALLAYVGESGLDRALERLVASSEDRDCQGFNACI